MNPKQQNLSDPSLQDIAQVLASFRTVDYTSWSATFHYKYREDNQIAVLNPASIIYVGL